MNLKTRRGTAYRYIIMLAFGLNVSEDVASESIDNCHGRQPHCRLTALPQGTLANI